MKSVLLLVVCGIVTFFASFLFFRPAMEAPRSSLSSSELKSSRRDATESRPTSPSGPNANTERNVTSKNKETLLVPPALVESIDISAIDPFSGEFTSGFKELLGLDAQELAATKEAFDGYFKAYAEVELTLATVVATEEHANGPPGDARLRRFATVLIEPAGDRLSAELQSMRERLVDLLGKPRGLAAAALIGRQLGNNGKGGEVVAFARYLGEEKYRIEITGVGDHALSAHQFGSAPIYDSPSFADFARYRHLDQLIRK